MSFVLILVAGGVVVAAILGIVSLASGERYAKMTEAEFEAEAQRARKLSGAMLSIQKIVDPGRKVEYVMQRDKKMEGEQSESGDVPEAGGKR